MIEILLAAAANGLFVAATVALYVWCVQPTLGWHRARRAAYAITGLAALAVPALQIVAFFAAVSAWWSIASLLVLMFAWVRPELVVRATGGPRALPGPVATVWEQSVCIGELLDVGAIDDAERTLSSLDSRRTTETGRMIDLWHRRIAEERQRRDGVRISSRPTMQDIGDEWRRLLAPPHVGRQGVPPVLAVALAASVGMTSTLIDHRACVAVEVMIATGPEPARGGTLPLQEALPRQIEDGAVLLFDESFGLDAAAESRSDPDTRRQLVDAGFVSSRLRDWEAADGVLIQADVFEFSEPAGALAFQYAVNRYACQFANHAFAAPFGGIGLQVYRAAGEPIEEQVSWVVGSRRYLVSHRALTRPDNHERVLRLFDAAEEGSRR